jgi:hypothetical protein
MANPASVRSYSYRIARQVFSECLSFGSDQLMPVLIAAATAWAAVHFGLIPTPQRRQEYEATVLLPFIFGLAVYLAWQLVRAPFVLDSEHLNRIETLEIQLNNALAALAPKLIIDFNSDDRQFIETTRLNEVLFDKVIGTFTKATNTTFIHVRPRCSGSSVFNCRGYLTEIAVPTDRDSWQPVFARSVPLFWAGREEGPQPITLYENVPEFLDVAYTLEGENFIHLLHPLSHPPNSMPQTIGPMDVFKLTIAVVGDNNARASICLTIKPGSVWSMPEVKEIASDAVESDNTL